MSEATGMVAAWRRGCFALHLALLALAAGTAGAQDQATARILDTEARLHQNNTIVVRGGVQITSRPHLWYGVHFQFRLDAETPLTVRDDQGEEKAFVKRWSDVFTPMEPAGPSRWADEWRYEANAPVTARWMDCRTAITFGEIEAATNLPKDKRTPVWVVCDIFDHARRQYIASGWDVRAPILLTTDAKGKITKFETFYTPTVEPLRNHDTLTIPAREMRLQLARLQPKPGVQAFRKVGAKHTMHDVMVLGRHQADVYSDSRGHFFQAIDTPGEALELAELPFARSVILKTPQQFQAIVQALQSIGRAVPDPEPAREGDGAAPPGPAPGPRIRELKVAEPPSYGVTVAAEPGLGYRVGLLLLQFDTYTRTLADVAHWEFHVATDGRLGSTRTLCIKGPETETSRPPGWVQPGPTSPEHYDTVVRKLLTPDGSEPIPRYLAVTDKEAACPAVEGDTSVDWYLPPADWPDHAKE